MFTKCVFSKLLLLINEIQGKKVLKKKNKEPNIAAWRLYYSFKKLKTPSLAARLYYLLEIFRK